MDQKDSIVGGDPFKRSSYFWEKKASQMLNLITGTGSSGSPKRSSASAAASTGGPGSPAPPSGSSMPLNGSNDSISRGSSSPGLSKRKSGTPAPETVAAAISASGPDRIDGTRSSSPGPSKSSQKAFRFSLPQNAGDLMGVPAQEKPERSPRNRPGYESDSRAQRKRSNSQHLTGMPNAIVALASSPKSKKRSNSVSSNPSSIKSDGKRKSASDLRNTSRSGSKSSISNGPLSPVVTVDRNRSESASSVTGDLVSAELVFSLQTTVASLTEQISSLQTALASEKQEREMLQTKVLDQERSISTLADAVQRQVSLLEHFRAELDSMKKLNASSSQNGTLATSTSEDAATLQSRSSTHALGTESVEEDSLPRPSRHRSSSKLKTDVAISSDSSRDKARDAATSTTNGGSPRKSSKDKARKAERKSSTREKLASRTESAYESDSTPARIRRRVNSAENSSRSAVSSGAIEASAAVSAPGSDSKTMISRSRSQTLHEKQSSDTSVSSKKPGQGRLPSKSADSVARPPSKISIKSPKSRSSVKLDAPAAESTDAARKTEVEFGGVEYSRSDSKPKVRRPASTTFGIEVLRRASEKDLDPVVADDSHGSPVTSPKPRNRSKSSRANKLLEQLTPAEQAETATSTLAANVASPPPTKAPKDFTSPRQDESLLSRSDSSSEEIAAFKKTPATPAPMLGSDKPVSTPTSRRGSFSEITSPKFDFSNRPVSEMEAPAESDESVGISKSAYGESDASSGADDSKAKQIIRKVNIFAVGARSFGVPLSQCQLDERASVPVVLATLANTLKNERPLPSDIFDRNVDATKVDALRKRIESATQSTVLRDTDIYLVAALFKRFFVELPEALLTAARRKSWLQVADIDDDMVRVPAVRSLFHGLDRINRKVLEYVVIFFNRLIDTSNGQLNLKQIASTFGPIFMRPTAQHPAVTMSPQTAPTSANRIDAIRRENSSIAVESSPTGEDFGDLTPDDVLEEKSVTLLAVFMRQYPNIFLLKCPGIEFHKRTYHVKAATVDNFVGLMLDSNYVEREFHDIFWSTYPYFIDSDDLLMRFTDLFYEYNALTRWESRYRMKVLFVLKLWIRRLGPALEHDSAFREDLAKFIDEALRRVADAPDDSLEKPMLLSLQNVKFSASVDSEGSMIVSRILAGASSSAGASANVTAPRLVRSPSKKRLMSSRGSPIDVLQLDPKSLAFQITLIDYKLVHMIGSNELISGNSMVPEKSPNYTAMVRHINRITHWVAFEILSRSSSTERARVLSFFIDVAYYCRKMCNFNGSWAVFGAFGLHPVSRLAQTWERLPRRDASRHKKLSALFEPRMNFSEYRKQLDRALHEGSCVPILAFLPKDIIRFETDPTFTEDRLVDFDKMRGIYQTLQLLSHCQNESGVPAGKVEELWDMLLGLPDFEEDELDSLSRKAEPRK